MSFDILEGVERRLVLDDGFVELVDMMPRLIPQGRTADFAIIRNARISTGSGLKSEEEDKRLLRYLYINQHSTPFESIELVFHLRLPRFVATHFHRHRTASINEFSERYSKVNTNSYFHPSKASDSLRVQGKMNRQSSETTSDDQRIKELVLQMEAKTDDIFADYNKLLELGVSKEVARSFLPLSTYTEMYFKINLRNLLHFLELRYHPHAQKETRDYAEAIYEITSQVIPATTALFDEITREGITLNKAEVEAIKTNSVYHPPSSSERQAFERKKDLLGLK